MQRRLAIVLLVLAGCSTSAGVATVTTLPPPAITPLPTPTTTTEQAVTTTRAPEADTTTSTAAVTTTTSSPFARPAWLGTRVLPLRPDGFGEVQPTPDELLDRRLETVDVLPPPTGDGFTSQVGPVPDDVLARSTWTEDCPVDSDDLAYVTMPFHGFDGEIHTGEMVVNAAVAEGIVDVFHALFDAGYPIEEMRVLRLDELDIPPTGDGNITGSFECRPATGGTSWSQHAYGLAIDVNPFHNPYAKGDLVLPELASAYVDRTDVRPGMIERGDAVFDAFASIGWGWGGDWNTLKDWMHFSRSGT